jgi:hypothetical protein
VIAIDDPGDLVINIFPPKLDDTSFPVLVATKNDEKERIGIIYSGLPLGK